MTESGGDQSIGQAGYERKPGDERVSRDNFRFLVSHFLARFPGDPLQDFFDREDYFDGRPPGLAPPVPWPPNQDCRDGCFAQYRAAIKAADAEWSDPYLRDQVKGFAAADFLQCISDCWGPSQDDDGPDTHVPPR